MKINVTHSDSDILETMPEGYHIIESSARTTLSRGMKRKHHLSGKEYYINVPARVTADKDESLKDITQSAMVNVLSAGLSEADLKAMLERRNLSRENPDEIQPDDRDRIVHQSVHKAVIDAIQANGMTGRTAERTKIRFEFLDAIAETDVECSDLEAVEATATMRQILASLTPAELKATVLHRKGVTMTSGQRVLLKRARDKAKRFLHEDRIADARTFAPTDDAPAVDQSLLAVDKGMIKRRHKASEKFGNKL